MATSIKQLQAIPLEQRWPMAQMQMAQMQRFGMSQEGITEADMNDEALQRHYDVVAPVAQMGTQGQEAASKRVVGNQTISVENGRAYGVSTVFDPLTNTLVPVKADLGLAANLSTNLGLNAQGQTDQVLSQATLKAQALSNQALADILAQSAPLAQATAEKDKASTAAKANTEATAAMIENGVSVRDGLKDLHVGLDLLNKMKTGGWESVKTKAAQWLGVDTANESEFIALTSRNLQDAMNAMPGVATKSDQDLVASGTFRLDIGKEANKRLIERYIEKGTIKYNQAKKLYENDPQTYSAYEGVFDYVPPKIGDSRNQNTEPKQPNAPATPKPTPAAPQGATGQKPSPVITKTMWDSLTPTEKQSYKAMTPGFQEPQ